MLPHLAARLFGTPLLIHQPKLEVILSVLGPRLGLPERAGQGGYVRPEHPVNESPSGIAVIPIHGTLLRRTSGLEADSGLTSYQSVQHMLGWRMTTRPSKPSCSISIPLEVNRVAYSIWPTRFVV